MTNLIYHLEVEVSGCSLKAHINGMIFFEAKGIDGPVKISKPISSMLIGKNNRIDFFIIPPFGILSQGQKPNYFISAKVKIYNLEDITGPEKGKVVAETRIENLPNGNLIFDNVVFDFSNRLINAEKLNSKEVENYAIHLRDLLKSKNQDLVLKEFLPKLDDYSQVYNDSKEATYFSFTDYLLKKFFYSDPRLNFEISDLNLKSWCDGRIWEIGIGPLNEEFMLSGIDEDGMEYTTRIFIGKVGKELKVIR